MENPKLINNFFPPMSKIQITAPEKVGNAIGFISYYTLEANNLNYKVHGIIIRKGKKGKDRLDTFAMKCSAYHTNDKQLESFIEEQSKEPCIFEAMPMETKNVFKMSNIEFAGWAYAYANFLHFIRHNYGNLEIWPKGGHKAINKLLKVNNYQKLMDQDPGKFYFDFTETAVRIEFINNIISMEFSIIRCIRLFNDQEGFIRNRALIMLYEAAKPKTKISKVIGKTLDNVRKGVFNV